MDDQEHGFWITRQAPAIHEKDFNQITIDIRVYAPHNTDRGKIVALLEEAVGQAGESVVWSWREVE